MQDKIKQNPVRYLLIPDTLGNVNLEKYLADIMNEHNGKIPIETLEKKLIKQCNDMPVARITDSILSRLFNADRSVEIIYLYPFANGIVHEKTPVYRTSLVN